MTKICPLLSIGKPQLQSCTKQCAFYNEKEKSCSIKEIATSIEFLSFKS